MDEVDDQEEFEQAEVEDGEEDGIPDAVRRKLETFVPELVRKTFAAGIGAAFATEEGIRRITREIPQAKDVVDYVAATAGSTKDDVMRVMARETREFLQTVNISEEIAKMLTMLSFEVKTEIRFIPNDEKYGGVEPDVKAKVRLKRNRDKGADTEEPEEETPERSRLRRRRLTFGGGRGGGGGDDSDNR